MRFNWKITAVGAKFQCYTDAIVIPWDKATETMADLKSKGISAFNDLKAADVSEANLIFNLEHLTL